MSVIVRLQNLPWSAVAADIRQFFSGLSIPEGGVNIVGGDLGDAFIAFSTDEDARLAMQRDGGKVKDAKVKLLLSSRTEMQRETARQQSLQMQYLQMQQMQSAQIAQATQPSAPTQPAATATVPAAAMPGYSMQAALTNNSITPAVPNLQPSAATIQNLQQHMFGQMMAAKTEPSPQPSSITPGMNAVPGMPGGPQMQFPQMMPYSMASTGTLSAMSAVNSPITCNPSSVSQPALLSASNTPLQARNQPNMQQLPPGQMPPYHTASPQQITQTPLPYQIPTSQVTQSPVSQGIMPQISHGPHLQTTNYHMTQPPNFQPPNQQMNMPPNFQPPTHQMPQPGFQPPLMNQPPPFQAGAPRMPQPQPTPFPPSNAQTNQNMPAFQPSFPPGPHAPQFQIANQQGSPASSIQSSSPQVSQAQNSQNFPKNSRFPPVQRRTENRANYDNSDSNKNERGRKSRAGSDSPGSRSRSHSREQRNRDKYPDKDRRRRNSREYRRGRRDRSWSKERRSSRDRKQDDSRGSRKGDKRSTDPKQLYKDYENPNSSFKPSVEPVSRSKVNTNSNSKTSSSTTASTTSTPTSTTVTTNLESSKLTTPKTTSDSNEKTENRESDKSKEVSNSQSITSTTNNYSDKSSQQNDQMNKIESSSSNKNVSSTGFSNSTSNEESNTNLSSKSPFIATDFNKTSHDDEESKYSSSPSKRKAPNDEYDKDSRHQNSAKHDEGGRRKRRGFDDPGRFHDDEDPNRMNYHEETRSEYQSGFRNERFNKFDSQCNGPNNYNYSQSSRFDWKSKCEPNCCVSIENFPIFNGPKDVIDFFHDLSPNMSIKLQRNEYGHLNSALIRFANYNDKEKGLKRNGFRLKKSIVNVTHISDREFDEADDDLDPQKESSKARLEEKMAFQAKRDLKTFQCLCLEGDQGVDPVFDCTNIYHENVRVVFNQINPVELFMHYGVYINRGFVRFENFAKASSAKNLLLGLVVDYVTIKILPCSDEQFAKFKEIVEKEGSHKKPANDNKNRNEANKKGKINSNKPMLPSSAPYGNRHDHRRSTDPRMGNKKDPRTLNSSRNEGMPEMSDFQNEEPYTNQRTLLPNPPMHNSPNKPVTKSSCIIMQGLPHNVHYQDIVNFFSSISIQPKEIHVMFDNGVPIGDAFCEFNNNREADMAVTRNNCQMGMNFVHVRLVTQEELDRAVGKNSSQHPLANVNNMSYGPPHMPLPPMAMNNMPPHAPPHMDNQMMMMGGGPGQFGGMEGGPPFGRDSGPPGDNGFRGGRRGAFNMGRGGGPPPMRGRGRGGFESGGRGGRGGFESGDHGEYDSGGFESGGHRGFESGGRGGRGRFDSGGRGGRDGYESGGRGGRGGFESGGRGGRDGYESGGRGGRGGFESGGRGGRGGRSFPPPAMNATPPMHNDKPDLLPDSKVDSFGKPGCVIAAENISFRADVNDIIDFFSKFNLVPENIIRRYDDFGQVTGDARIAFQSPSDAAEAVRMYDQTWMMKRMIRLSLLR